MARANRNGALFTIGYEGKSIDCYIEQLSSAGVSLLCDVRANPLSRKRGFFKRSLAATCALHGIRYEHVPALGIASAERKAVHTPADRQAMFERYEQITLPREQGELEKIRRWIVEDRQRVALTCFEANPNECHRHCVACALAASGVEPPVHL